MQNQPNLSGALTFKYTGYNNIQTIDDIPQIKIDEWKVFARTATRQEFYSYLFSRPQIYVTRGYDYLNVKIKSKDAYLARSRKVNNILYSNLAKYCIN